MKSIFDKTPYIPNEKGLEKAYNSDKYLYQNGSTLFIGGTNETRYHR